MSIAEKQKVTNLDWTTLIQQSAPYTNLVSTKDPVSGLVDITYYGLKTSLSEVLKGSPTGAHSVAIFADTLLLDVPDFTTTALLLVVRDFDVSGLNGEPLLLTPQSEGDVVVQIMIGSVTGGSFTFNLSGQDGTPANPPVGTENLSAPVYMAKKGEKTFTELTSGGNSGVEDLISTTWMMNSLYASFSAAAWLMDDSSEIARSTSQKMLTWVFGGTSNLKVNDSLPSDYSQLYNQAAALLVTLNIAPGATFVPILSGSYYSKHLSDIITVIRDYESKMNLLETEKDIAKAIATVSSTLQSVASDEVAPLQVQLDSISANTKSLFQDIVDLSGNFQLQFKTSETYFNVMITEATLDRIRDRVKAALNTVFDVITTAYDVVQIEEGSMGAAFENAVNSVEDAVVFIQSLSDPNTGDDLSKKAVELLEGQMAILKTVWDSHSLWQQALENKSGGVLPANLSAITIDPTTDWDNYLASAEAEISKLERGFETAGKNAADNYLASLKILAGYGKAIGGKFVAYIGQMVQGSIVMAQIKAARDVEKRWENAKENATSDEEKLTALKALVQGRLQAIKRSLYLAWTYYEASYFYLNFEAPPRVLHMNMDASELEAALVGVSDWVAQAISSSPDGQHVQLPNENVDIKFAFQILQHDGRPAPDKDTAMLNQTDDGGWSLAFTVPLGTSQLNDVLPNNGNVAIWISKAEFFIKGITPNIKKNVIAEISTSGTYQNGFGESQSYTFVTKGLTGDYAYNTTNNDKVYIPWEINTAVYMTPTPYTQWNIHFGSDGGDLTKATELLVKMTVAYRSS